MYSFSFFAGVAALLALPELPSGRLAIALGLLAFAGGVCWRRWRFAAAVCGACCGFLFAACHARDTLSHRWPERLEDERVIARVVVDSIPAPLESGWAFDGVVRIERPERAPAGVSVAWGDAFRVRLVSRDPQVRPHAGEEWRMLLSLRAPTGRANPGAQDFERSLFRDGVHALGSVVASDLNRRLDDGHRPLARLRERISERIDARVTDRDASALIAALAVGDTGRVSREQWRVFNVTGTTHLVAISGMHVTLFAVIMFALARRVWSAGVALGASAASGAAPPSALRPALPGMRALRGPCRRLVSLVRALGRAVSSIPRETFAAVFGFLAAAGYAALAGLSVPTERTLIMLGVWLFARSIARQSHPFQPFALALLLVLLVDPFAPLSAGFWLSFAAMAAIILSAQGRFTRPPLWREALSVQLVVSIALLPFTFALFGAIPLIGMPVNLLAIPAMSWVLVPTVLLALALLPISSLASDAVLRLAEWLHNLGYPWLAAASDVPWALIHASPPWWWYALAVVALAMAALPWPLLMRIAPLICIAPLAASIDRPLKPGSAEITVLDVGEGSAVVVRTRAHTLVYGTGDSYGTNGRVAESVVVPFLRNSGVHAVDRIVIPRASPASGAGVVALSAEMPVRQMLVGDPVDAVDASIADCASVPSPWHWDGVTFVLGPPGAGHACALTIRTGGAGEVRVLGEIDATIVEGGAGAGGPRWLVVSSRRAQRSVEKYARFHPELQTAEVLASADQGAMRVRLDGARGPGIPEAYRAHRRTLWSASP
jgi:competence protein ComEC